MRVAKDRSVIWPEGVAHAATDADVPGLLRDPQTTFVQELGWNVFRVWHADVSYLVEVPEGHDDLRLLRDRVGRRLYT